MLHPLRTADNHFDRAAIMVRAWSRARRDMKAGWSARQALASALRFTWDEARGARNIAFWQAEQTAAQAALATLDARTHEIAELRFDRFAANGIDNARAHRAEIERIHARLLVLAA